MEETIILNVWPFEPLLTEQGGGCNSIPKEFPRAFSKTQNIP